MATENKSYSGRGSSLYVNGADVDQAVGFSLVTFSIAFTESPLPSGTEWWVNLSGDQSMQASAGGSGSTRTFSEPNGSPAKLFLGLPGLEGYGVLGALLALAIVLAFLIVGRRRKKKDDPNAAPPPGPANADAGPAPPNR